MNGERVFYFVFLTLALNMVVTLFAGGKAERRDSMISASRTESSNKGVPKGKNIDYAVLGGGCFWCMEAVFERIDGVISVTSGYAGGITVDPGYEEVSSGKTGHAEVIKIIYDRDKITYPELLDVFWHSHDPTTPNRQGADLGSQYRSIILYHDSEQKREAEESLLRMSHSGRFNSPIVTEIKPLKAFYPAEEYHQNYYDKHPFAGYCRLVIEPKLEKLGLENKKSLEFEER